MGGPAFSSRISRKPGRPQDWAAQPLLTLTGSDALADPVSLQRVRQYHDEPIRQAYLTANGVNPGALAMLAEQARFASRQFQGKLRLAGLLR